MDIMTLQQPSARLKTYTEHTTMQCGARCGVTSFRYTKLHFEDVTRCDAITITNQIEESEI